MVLNVIEPAQTRYILAAGDLENFLKEKFSDEYPDYDFKVEVCSTIKKSNQVHSLLSCSMYAIGGPSKHLRK
jgi:CDP-diacylglycerol pyrophosphatase